MFEVSVEYHFDAAHYLRGYQGKCEKVHGHRFRVMATVKTKKLDNLGMGYDFTELKRHLREVIDSFDHVCLNDLPAFQERNPSSENIAVTIYQELQPLLGKLNLAWVEVWESPESHVRYIPDR
ncbi:MAG: 6-pyruvoyl tetrahydrobiopterin synthase [Dehalococcoidia bacterium]|nr:6-pyruvoyl tetrahydrobiopterin synthase [Dehalococcoidia bacterium]